jgi:hypothetical protein
MNFRLYKLTGEVWVGQANELFVRRLLRDLYEALPEGLGANLGCQITESQPFFRKKTSNFDME